MPPDPPPLSDDPPWSGGADARAIRDLGRALAADPPGGPAARAAFEALHARLGPGVTRFFLKRLGRDHDTADDLAQRAWAGFWDAARRARFDPERSSPSTFLYAIALKTWLSHCRAAGRAPDEQDLLAAGVAREPADAPVPDAAAHAELLEAIRRVLAGGDDSGLTADEILVLRAIAQGVTDRSLAGQLGVSASTAHARKRSAFQKLRRRLGALGFRAGDAPDPPPGVPHPPVPAERPGDGSKETGRGSA